MAGINPNPEPPDTEFLDTMHHWHISQNLHSASRAAAGFLEAEIRQCLKNKADCHIALPGGNTPAESLGLLAQADLPWERLHWYLGDERCLPPGNKQRNDRMINRHFCQPLAKRLGQASAEGLSARFYPIQAELGAEQAARRYRQRLDSVQLDIAFLGMGEDGHTASLFPGNPALDDPASVVAVQHSPKPPAERVSLGVSCLKQAAVRLILSAGESKAAILQQVRQGADLPVNRIGGIHWFIDQAAAGD